MSKPGRNDPCYCGSGKKYKQCHLRSDQAAESEQRRRSEAARFLRSDLPRFARLERFEKRFDEGLPLYWNGYYEPDNAHEMSQFEALRYLDWLMFDFAPEGKERLLDLYVAEERDGLKEPQKALLDAWIEAPAAAAYELDGYEGQSLQLKDFVTGDSFVVFEASGRGNVKVGELILARLVPLEDHFEFSTPAGYLPANEISDLRQKLEDAQKADAKAHPKATYDEFMRRNNFILIHHALEEAEKAKRPPVARMDPHRTDSELPGRTGFHDSGSVRPQRNYGSTLQQTTQTRRKAI